MSTRRGFPSGRTVAIETTTIITDIVDRINIKMLVKLHHAVAIRRGFKIVEAHYSPLAAKLASTNPAAVVIAFEGCQLQYEVISRMNGVYCDQLSIGLPALKRCSSTKASKYPS
jgi:hypothetical protein